MSDTTSERPRNDKGHFIPKSEEDTAADVAAMIEENPGLLRSILNKCKQSPVLAHLAEKNTEAAQLAAKAKVGGIILGRIRHNILLPILPDQYKGVLDSTLVSGAVDFGMGNLIMVISEMTKDKLPERMQPYAGWLGEATVLAAYQNSLARIDLEGFVQKVLSGDVMAMLDGAFKPDSK